MCVNQVREEVEDEVISSGLLWIHHIGPLFTTVASVAGVDDCSWLLLVKTAKSEEVLHFLFCFFENKNDFNEEKYLQPSCHAAQPQLLNCTTSIRKILKWRFPTWKSITPAVFRHLCRNKIKNRLFENFKHKKKENIAFCTVDLSFVFCFFAEITNTGRHLSVVGTRLNDGGERVCGGWVGLWILCSGWTGLGAPMLTHWVFWGLQKAPTQCWNAGRSL